jgi:hypothetical protein
MVAELLSDMFWSFWNLATWMVIVFPPDKPMATWSLFSELVSFDLLDLLEVMLSGRVTIN